MLILASASPRRRELLRKLVPSFIAVVPYVDERVMDGVRKPKDLSTEEARLKAYEIFSMNPDDEVLG
ncbi:MAG: Maf family protein, partial [Bacilli bacterium]|nr:Maf family protein [Bacilli bacterium]